MKKTIKDITFDKLQLLVEQGVAVSKLDRATFAVGLAIEYKVNPNTVGRAFRLFLANKHWDSITTSSPIVYNNNNTSK